MTYTTGERGGHNIPESSGGMRSCGYSPLQHGSLMSSDGASANYPGCCQRLPLSTKVQFTVRMMRRSQLTSDPEKWVKIKKNAIFLCALGGSKWLNKRGTAMSYVCNINVAKSSRMLQDGEGRVVAIFSDSCAAPILKTVFCCKDKRPLWNAQHDWFC